jgi:integrase
MLCLKYLAAQNENQLEYLSKQSEQMNELLLEKEKMTKQMNILTNEAERRIIIEKQKQMIKEKRANRKIKPSAQPFTREMVQDLFLTVKGKSYLNARLRCAYTILTITGIRCEELRTLKVKQVQTLFTDHYVPITRKKRGPANKKAFLRKCGIQF